METTRATSPHRTLCTFPVIFSVMMNPLVGHTHTLNHYICQQTLEHYSIIEVGSLNHILSCFKSLCAGIREVNLSVTAVCCHVYSSSCSLLPLPLRTHNNLLDPQGYRGRCVCSLMLQKDSSHTHNHSEHTDKYPRAHTHTQTSESTGAELGVVISHTFPVSTVC